MVWSATRSSAWAGRGMKENHRISGDPKTQSEARTESTTGARGNGPVKEKRK